MISNISDILKVVLGMSFFDFCMVWFVPFPSLEHLEFARLIVAVGGLVIGCLILYFKKKDYNVNKKTNEILKQQQKQIERDKDKYDSIIWHSDYRKKEDKE